MSNETTNDTEADEQPLQEQSTDQAELANDADQTVEFTEVVDGEPAGEEDTSIAGQLKIELAAAENRALMAVADLENYRKRAKKQIQDQTRYASIGMMGEILESVDNLNRAVEAAQKEGSNSALLEGVKMVADQILGILKSNKCEQIESIGQPFDPNQHQAIQMQPSDEFEANTVMVEALAGYKLHDRIIRPAQVFVSTGPATES